MKICHNKILKVISLGGLIVSFIAAYVYFAYPSHKIQRPANHQRYYDVDKLEEHADLIVVGEPD